jgi:DNA-binding FrmR family transcriptional regulator
VEEKEQTERRVISRLRRIEGQIQGLQRMIEEGKDCAEVITQLSAARSALDQVGFIILSHRMEECLRRNIEKGEDCQKAFEDLMTLFLKLA